MATLTKIATGAAVAAGSPFSGSWTNEQNARVAVSDLTAAGSGTYATCAPGKNQEFASLWPFVFSEIPAGSTINSVSVKVQWKESTTSSIATLQSTMFADNGSGSPDQATALSASPGVQRDSAHEVTVDTDDTYSATPSLAQLQQGVWVRVQALRGNSNTACTFSLEYIQVTVDYTAPATNVALNQASETDTAQALGKKKIRALAQAHGTLTGTPVVVDSYAFSNANAVQNYGTTIFGVGQSFTPSLGGPLVAASFWLDKNTGTAGSISAKLYAEAGGKPTGSALAVSTNSINVTSLPASFAEQVFSFDGTYELQAGVTYVITAEISGLSGSPQAAVDTASPTHAGVTSTLSNTGTWTSFSGIDTIFSVSSAALISDVAQPFTVVQSAGGTVVALNQASESGTVQALSAKKTKAFNQASETDTAQAVTKKKTKAVGQTTESDTAQSVAKVKKKALAQASETDIAQPVAKSKRKALAQATETDAAQTFGRLKTRTVGQVSENSTAQSFAKSKVHALGQASDTNTAQSFSLPGSTVVAIGQASESSAAQAFTRAKVKALGQVVELSSATAWRAVKSRTISVSTDTHVAQTLSRVKNAAVGQAAELGITHSFTAIGGTPAVSTGDWAHRMRRRRR